MSATRAHTSSRESAIRQATPAVADPDLEPTLLRLQRLAGNQAVGRLIGSARGPEVGRPLPPSIRASLEQDFQADLGAVRLHEDSVAVAATAMAGARATTVGTDILLSRPLAALPSDVATRLLRHEVTHVLQQARGRIHQGDPGAAEAEAEQSAAAPAGLPTPVTRGATEGAPQHQLLTDQEILRRIAEIEQRTATASLAPDELERLNAERDALSVVLARRGETPDIDVGVLREQLKAEAWNVDTVAAALTDEEIAGLDLDTRMQAVQQIADGVMVGDEDEQTIIRLLRLAPDPQAAAIYARLRADGSRLYQRLEEVLDGEEYRQYHLVVRQLAMRSLAGQPAGSVASALERARILPWADTGWVKGYYKQRIVYEEVAFTEDGKITFVLRRSFWGFPQEKRKIVVDPSEIIGVEFEVDEEHEGASAGKVVYMPAINFLNLISKQERAQYEFIGEVAMFASGVGGAVGATTRLARAVAVVDAAVGAAGIVLRDFRSEIAGTPAGARFLRHWDQFMTLYAIIGGVRMLRELPQAYRSIRSAYAEFKTAAGAKLSKEAAAGVERQMAALDESMDRAAAESAQGGASPAAESLEAAKPPPVAPSGPAAESLEAAKPPPVAPSGPAAESLEAAKPPPVAPSGPAAESLEAAKPPPVAPSGPAAESLEAAKPPPVPPSRWWQGRVGYGEGPLSQLAQRLRLSLGLRRGGNVAVFEFETIPEGFRQMATRLGGKNILIEGNRMAVQNVSGAAHSEQLAHELITEGRKAGLTLNPRRIYTEYNPCTDTCLPLIREKYPSAEVSYSFRWERWGRESPDRNAAVDALFQGQ